MKEIIIRNRYYCIPLLIFLLLGVLFVLPKGNVVLWLNEHHSPILDTFFKYYTNVGDGAVFGMLVLLFLFIRYSYFFLSLSIALSCMFISQFSKRVIFSDMIRPKLFFAERGQLLNAIDGVKMHGYHSFPSGHTLTVVAYTLMLALLLPNKKWGVVLFLFAWIGGVSRIYLAQHFLMDVYAGTILGSIITFFYYFGMEKKGWFKNPWLKENNLITTIQTFVR